MEKEWPHPWSPSPTLIHYIKPGPGLTCCLKLLEALLLVSFSLIHRRPNLKPGCSGLVGLEVPGHCQIRECREYAFLQVRVNRQCLSSFIICLGDWLWKILSLYRHCHRLRSSSGRCYQSFIPFILISCRNRTLLIRCLAKVLRTFGQVDAISSKSARKCNGDERKLCRFNKQETAYFK